MPRRRRRRARRRCARGVLGRGRRRRRPHAYQRRLGDSVPLRNAPWFGTHNSFNSVAEMGPARVGHGLQPAALAGRSAARRRPVARARRPLVPEREHRRRDGARSSATPRARPGARSRRRSATRSRRSATGCARTRRRSCSSTSRTSSRATEGEDAAAAAVEEQIGDLVYRPAGPAGQCTELPLDKTRNDVRAAGKQVLIVGSCGTAASWRGLVHGWSTPRGDAAAGLLLPRRLRPGPLRRDDHPVLRGRHMADVGRRRTSAPRRATTASTPRRPRRCCAAASTCSGSTSSPPTTPARPRRSGAGPTASRRTRTARSWSRTVAGAARSTCTTSRPFGVHQRVGPGVLPQGPRPRHEAAEGLRDPAHRLRERARPPGRRRARRLAAAPALTRSRATAHP